ncbi:hypothetical protein Tco_0396633 [Tanacetum coccineum]
MKNWLSQSKRLLNYSKGDIESPIEISALGANSLQAENSDEELEEPMKNQPLPANASPTTLSLDYIADSDPDEEEETQEDHADHPPTEERQ